MTRKQTLKLPTLSSKRFLKPIKKTCSRTFHLMRYSMRGLLASPTTTLMPSTSSTSAISPAPTGVLSTVDVAWVQKLLCLCRLQEDEVQGSWGWLACICYSLWFILLLICLRMRLLWQALLQKDSFPHQLSRQVAHQGKVSYLQIALLSDYLLSARCSDWRLKVCSCLLDGSSCQGTTPSM